MPVYLEKIKAIAKGISYRRRSDLGLSRFLKGGVACYQNP